MKVQTVLTLLVAFFVVATPSVFAESQTPVATQSQTVAYISDTLKVPLRAGASNRYRVIGSVRGGAVVKILKSDPKQGFTRIRTPEGVRGWIVTEHLSNETGGRLQLVEVRQELEKLQAQYDELQRHMEDLAGKPGDQKLSYAQLYEEFLQLRQRFAQYRKAAAETVAIDERNQFLEEQTVMLERELRVAEQENQTLRHDSETTRMLMTLVLLGVGLVVVVFMPRMRAQRSAQWSQL